MIKISQMFKKNLANLVIIAVFIYSAVFFTIANGKTVKVPDPKVDLVFMFDESASMTFKPESFRRAVDGLRTWALEYATVGLTRLAVVRCNHKFADHKLGDEQVPAVVTGKFPNTSADLEDEAYVERCFQVVKDHVFIQDKGDRPDAPNIILCKLHTL